MSLASASTWRWMSLIGSPTGRHRTLSSLGACVRVCVQGWLDKVWTAPMDLYAPAPVHCRKTPEPDMTDHMLSLTTCKRTRAN